MRQALDINREERIVSHFSVMVVTDGEPSGDMLSEIMQPYHEFECTGEDDKYVQNIDRTEEAKAKYAEYLAGESGKPESFLEWVKGWYGIERVLSLLKPDYEKLHKYGYVRVDDKGEVLEVIDRTNPNNKWDYWRVGGRYRAKLQVKDGVASAVASEPSWEFEGQPVPEGFDSACVADIDFDKMKAVAVQSREEWVRVCLTKCGLSREAFGVGCSQQKESHAKWMELTPPEQRPRGTEYKQWLREVGYVNLADAMEGNWEIPDIGTMTLDQWIAAAPPLSAFAVVKDGNWYEQGRMGWWACVSDEDDQWDEKFNELVASLQPTQWITFLDCHI